MTSRPVPPPLLVAAALVLVEGLVAVIFGVAELADLDAKRVAMGVTTAGFFVVLGVALGLCAWGLRALRTWARGPVLLTQLIALGLAWNFRGGETWGISVALVIPALVVLAGMLHPATMAALEGEDERESENGDRD
ncbi:MAG: hypothetical protein J7518_00150 [Nocardioidaceae bacterium]|nr:hypothetical protein [Nocardioidaceae bacterium]